MGNFNRDNRFSRGSGSRSPRFEGGRDFGRRDFERPQLFKAVCSKCGKDCEVPFKPTGSKPVFCRDCFKANGGFDANRSEARSFGRPQFDNRTNDRPTAAPLQPNYKEQFEAINSKLDKILKILTPTVYEKVVEVKEKPQEKIVVATEKQPEEKPIEVIKKKKRASKNKTEIKEE